MMKLVIIVTRKIIRKGNYEIKCWGLNLWDYLVLSFIFGLFIGIVNFVPKVIILCLFLLINVGCLYILPFKHEAKKAKNKLIEILKCEELDKNNLKGAL